MRKKREEFWVAYVRIYQEIGLSLSELPLFWIFMIYEGFYMGLMEKSENRRHFESEKGGTLGGVCGFL